MFPDHVKKTLLSVSMRGTGKSSILAEGVARYPGKFILVCRSIQEGRRLTLGNPNAIYLCPPESYVLGHADLPIVFDQEEVKGYLHAIVLQQEEIDLLEQKVYELKQQLKEKENGNTRQQPEANS